MTRALPLIAALACSMPLFFAHPAHAYELSKEDAEILGRHGEASTEAFVKFGNVGETLTHISSSKFAGTGSQRRQMSRLVDAAMQPWRGASAAAKGSLSYKVLPVAFTVADEGMAMLGSYAEDDNRGITSTAVSVAVERVAVGEGVKLFGALGTGAGAMLGSFVPVVGNALGGMVGGAVGTVAGGYLSSYAYDKYIKGLVIRAVEGGFVAVFDTAPLQQAMQAKQAFLHENASPEVMAEWDRMNAVSRSFGGGEGQLLDWERLPHIVERKPPLSTDAQQQAALPPVASLPPMTRFEIRISSGSGGATVDDCRIDEDRVNCVSRWENPPSWLVSYTGSFIGRLSGTIVTGTTTSHITNRNAGCTANEDYNGPVVFVLSADGVVKLRAGPIQRRSTFSGSCSGANSGSSGPNEATARWRVVE